MIIQKGANGDCNIKLCCRNNKLASKNLTDSQKAGKYGYLGHCDLPIITVDSFLNYSIYEIKPDFMIYLGDNPAHNTWEQHKETHLDSLKHITNRLLNEYNGRVFPVLGNHEGMPCDYFDPKVHEWLIKETGELWGKWLVDGTKDYIEKQSYSVLVESKSKLRIIGLSPFVMLNGNRYLWKNQTDPQGVLAFLEQELKKAEMNKESVIILEHCPLNFLPVNPRIFF